VQSWADLFLSHPFWAWMAAGAVLLAVEIGMGTGYLLWPAGSAMAVAVLTLLLHNDVAVQVLIFALLTIATTVIGRRYLPKPFRPHGPDINDRAGRLVGRFGEIVRPFEAGRGRVFVDGSEWAAEVAAGAAEPDVGARVEVTEVLGAARLKVKAV
jgi:membrane protein implicated in regulation of membrane protease activity